MSIQNLQGQRASTKMIINKEEIIQKDGGDRISDVIIPYFRSIFLEGDSLYTGKQMRAISLIPLRCALDAKQWKEFSRSLTEILNRIFSLSFFKNEGREEKLKEAKKNWEVLDKEIEMLYSEQSSFVNAICPSISSSILASQPSLSLFDKQEVSHQLESQILAWQKEIENLHIKLKEKQEELDCAQYLLKQTQKNIEEAKQESHRILEKLNKELNERQQESDSCKSAYQKISHDLKILEKKVLRCQWARGFLDILMGSSDSLSPSLSMPSPELLRSCESLFLEFALYCVGYKLLLIRKWAKEKPSISIEVEHVTAQYGQRLFQLVFSNHGEAWEEEMLLMFHKGARGNICQAFDFLKSEKLKPFFYQHLEEKELRLLNREAQINDLLKSTLAGANKPQDPQVSIENSLHMLHTGSNTLENQRSLFLSIAAKIIGIVYASKLERRGHLRDKGKKLNSQKENSLKNPPSDIGPKTHRADSQGVNNAYDQGRVWNKSNIATVLWKDSATIISDEMVGKVNVVDAYLKEIGFGLRGVKADGNCFCYAFLESYATLSRKIPLLDTQRDRVSYLREVIASQYERSPEGAKNTNRVEGIKRDKEWITVLDEGDLLAVALKISIRVVTVNADVSGCGISDLLTSPESDKPRQEWSTIPEDEKPREFIFIVDLGGHFVYAQNTSCSSYSVSKRQEIVASSSINTSNLSKTCPSYHSSSVKHSELSVAHLQELKSIACYQHSSNDLYIKLYPDLQKACGKAVIKTQNVQINDSEVSNIAMTFLRSGQEQVLGQDEVNRLLKKIQDLNCPNCIDDLIAQGIKFLQKESEGRISETVTRQKIKSSGSFLIKKDDRNNQAINSFIEKALLYLATAYILSRELNLKGEKWDFIKAQLNSALQRLPLKQDENLLHRTALLKNVTLFDYLFTEPIDLINPHEIINEEKRGLMRETPLAIAVKGGDVESTRLLIQHGADIKKGNDDSYSWAKTVLHLATEEGHEAIVDLLLQHSEIKEILNAKTGYQKQTALHIAAHKGYLSTFKKLLEADAKTELVDSIGDTPLDCLLKSRSNNFAEQDKLACTLLNKKAPIFFHSQGNSKLEFMLRNAIRQGLLNAAKKLYGEPLSISQEQKNSLLNIAVEEAFRPNISGLEVSSKNRQAYIDMICWLIQEKGINPHQELKGYSGFLIHKACEESCMQIIRLFERSTDLELRDSKDDSTLHYACMSEVDCTDVVNFLIEHCPSLLNAENQAGQTPLHLASSHGHEGIVSILLSYPQVKVQLNEQDNDGNTPLHLSAQCIYTPFSKKTIEEYRKIALKLLELGANPALTNREGKIALDIAKESGYNQLFESLNLLNPPK